MLHPHCKTLGAILLGLSLVVACGVPAPPQTPVARVATRVPTFTLAPVSTATRTSTPTPTPTASLTPTETPFPTATSTNTPRPSTPTSTPTPSATSTDTPTPTSVPPTKALPTKALPTKAPPTPAPKPKSPTATPLPGDGFDFDITMQRMMSIDENGGVIGNHNIYVHAYDAHGNPLNGVVICRVYALQLSPPDPHACGTTGEAGEGRMHFDVYSGDIVYVATQDPEHRPRSPYTRPLEQEPAAMSNLQELVDNGYCASIQDCQERIPINNLVRFHYSYEVHFQRRW